MKDININKQENIRVVQFPDGQPHVTISNIEAADEVKVICSITNSNLLLQLLECANALDKVLAKKKILVIPYLLGARYDRVMQPGDSLDLEVIAGLINSMAFEKVYLLDVHSEVANSLIKNSANITNEVLVKAYEKENAVLICPDKGAGRKIDSYLLWNTNLTETVYCNKSRDLATGKITLQVTDPEKCKGRNCVIIDDLCDGGGTFLAIASQIQPAHLTLIATHGIFSKGLTVLEEKFNSIIVSDSYRSDYNSPIVKLIPAPVNI